MELVQYTGPGDSLLSDDSKSIFNWGNVDLSSMKPYSSSKGSFTGNVQD